jgi:hypoxanthine-DNA glycosylase
MAPIPVAPTVAVSTGCAPALVGLPPLIGPAIHTLVLGSFPGAASLAAQQYYAHPRNQLWPLLSALTGDDLAALPYAERLPCLLAHGIGLWDVIGACERAGSLDSAIRNAEANDFRLLRARCPALAMIGFNGQASGKFAPGFAAAGFKTLVLPSSSPAHATLSFEQKLSAWRQLLACAGSGAAKTERGTTSFLRQ